MSRARTAFAELSDTVPDGVIRTAELRAAGVSGYAVTARCRPSGPWQRLFPGVVLLSNRPPSRRQRLRAALLYAGDGAVLTGTAALREHAVDVPASDELLVLVPACRQVAGQPYLTVERTTRPPEPVWRDGLALAPVARATLDAARREVDQARLRQLLLAPIRAGACSPAELRAELRSGNQRGTAGPRQVLSELADEPAPELRLAKRLLVDGPLPLPAWQVQLCDASGMSLGTADAWWEEVGMIWDIGTRSPTRPVAGRAPGGAVLASATKLVACGLTVLYTTARRLRADPDGVLRELTFTFRRAAGRARPLVYRC